MPFYDLRCAACDREFNLLASVTDKTERRIACPECGSRELETVFKAAPAYLKGGGGKGPECPKRHICGSGCPHGGL
ncbi:MAG: zinc ribbon domain-containing protein [Oscillospiraceae bacterium]|nr:zinc ribbon domain-containing protein [Oscillospiraceae bacterium]